jgi:hypothetical protein
MDNYFSSPYLFNDLATKHCQTLHEGDAIGLRAPENNKHDDLQVRTRGDLTAIQLRDKCNIHMLTNIHDVLADSNFCNYNRKAIKLQTVADSKHHMGYVDKGDRMTNSNSINHCTWKWTQKLFFHLSNLAILNSYILLLLSSCG